MAVIARRSGDTWYVGGINGQNELVEFTPNLGFLGNGSYKSLLIADGADFKMFNISNSKVDKAANTTIKMLPFGGFVMKLEK